MSTKTSTPPVLYNGDEGNDEWRQRIERAKVAHKAGTTAKPTPAMKSQESRRDQLALRRSR
jgi:hypothetical protein